MEDLRGGLEKVNEMDWKSEFRSVILITDAPAHGEKYYDKNVFQLWG